ncbi:ferritin-like domain-containing protein [Crossiella sp. NPDC003009]
MTSPQPSGSTAAMEPEALAALQRALAAEHAADWAYGLATAFVKDTQQNALREGTTQHRARRDTTERLLRDVGTTPVPAEPAYAPPQPVTDQPTAITLLVTAETDTAAAWRAVLERTTDANLRRTSLDALTAAAVRATRWRKAGGATPLTVPFPGQP